MMVEFIPFQKEYSFFLYGFSYLLLIPICLFLRRNSYKGLPWIWLVWFGVLHGTNEWLDVRLLGIEPGPALDFIQLILLSLSFVCLAEFGRSGSQIIHGQSPGRWILAVLAALAGVGGVAGFPGLFACSSYFLGLTGGLWAAAALFLAARNEATESWPLQAGALSMAMYALIAGLVTSPAPFFPASWLNANIFLSSTGWPIQLFQSMAAVSLSASLGFCLPALLKRDHYSHNWHRYLLMGAAGGFTLIALGGCFVTRYAEHLAASMSPGSGGRFIGIGFILLLSVAFIGTLAFLATIRESEEGFWQLFENTPDNVFLHEKGRIIRVNEEACRSLGYTREELLQMSIFDIEVGYSKEFLLDLWEKERDVVTHSGIYRRKDGLTFPTEIRAGEITYGGRTMRLAAARDVSARKQAEEALQESEEYYRSLFTNMLDGYAYCQMYFEQGRPVDFVFLNVNKSFGDLTGLMEVIGKKITEVIPDAKESVSEFLEMCGRVAVTGIPERAEIYLKPLNMWLSISVYSPLKEYFVALFDVITERKTAEEALRASEAALRQSQERYRMLAGQLLHAQEVERKRLARELHDDLSQRLAGLAMEAEMLGQQLPPKGAAAAELKEMKDELVQLSIDVHSLSRQLHPSILDDLGLADAIASECARFRRQYAIAIDIGTENISKEIPPDIAVCLYRIVQEGLRNISKHARATEVTIALVGKDDSLLLTIMDNGRGFDLGKKRQKGLGIDSMKERVYIIGGDFSVRSHPGKGTVIKVLAPLLGNRQATEQDTSWQ